MSIKMTILLASLLVGVTTLTYAQETTNLDSNDRDESKAVLDHAPFVSARAAGMGGGLSTLADGLHAPYYNPAGIGGIHWGRTNPPFVRQLSFPYVGVAANESSSQLANTGSSGTDQTVETAILDASEGKRQYFRASGLLSLGLGRTIMLHSQDTQIAAYKNNDHATSESEGPIKISYRSQSLTGAGASVSDPDERIYLGAFVGHIVQSHFKGNINYEQIIDQQTRSSIIEKHRATYDGIATNLGLIWILNKKMRPAIGVAIRNAGNTTLSLNKKPQDTTVEAAEKLKLPEDLTVGFSISPRISKNSLVNFIMEGTNLTNQDIAVTKKFRTAVEYNWGGFGSEAIIGMRAGYNLAGVSAGLSLNLNLVQIEFASQAEDIGIANRHLVERRNIAIFSVNVRDN